MKRVLFFIIAIYLMLPLCANAIINPEYKKEVINWCPSFEETELNEKLIEKYNCGAASKEYYAKKQFDTAFDYAKKLKYIYRTRDINALAEIAPYPEVYIHNYKNKDFMEIKSKQQLLKLDKNALFGKSAYNEINNNAIFWNWRGFMLGAGSLWFFVENNGNIGNLSIYVN